MGLAAINTGNNLLFLLFGALCGFIALSGWLSERVIRGLRVERRLPRAAVAGEPFRVFYRVKNGKRWWPSYAVELSETVLDGAGFLPSLRAGESTDVSVSMTAPKRGVHPLGKITIGTGFPFGLFRKERDVDTPSKLTVWPRSDRPVELPALAGGREARVGVDGNRASTTRGEYRSLREFRSGDDPRDIHWKSTARLGEPVIRQYQDRGGPTVWVCLDLRGPAGDDAEESVERAASLARTLDRNGRRVGLVAGDHRVDPGRGSGHLERIFDALARVEFSPRAPASVPPRGEAHLPVSRERRPVSRGAA